MEENTPLAVSLCRGLSAARERLEQRGRTARPAPGCPGGIHDCRPGTQDVPGRAASSGGNRDNTPRRAGPHAGLLQPGERGRAPLRVSGPDGIHEHHHGGQGVSRGVLQRGTEPGLALLCPEASARTRWPQSSAASPAYGHAIGVGSSYAGFLAPLAHIAARLHAIGGQARAATEPGPYRPLILVCAHAGLKTGEDGPTHADPQALQVLQENFPRGTAVTLTPWTRRRSGSCSPPRWHGGPR